MIKMLFLDDDYVRHDSFERWIKHQNLEAQVDYVSTSKEAIEYLSKNPYDFIFLDHDLGNKTFVDVKEENTGSTVASFLFSHPDLSFNSPIIIHSFNPVGAENMEEILKKAGRPYVLRVPFSVLLKSKIRF